MKLQDFVFPAPISKKAENWRDEYHSTQRSLLTGGAWVCLCQGVSATIGTFLCTASQVNPHDWLCAEIGCGDGNP